MDGKIIIFIFHRTVWIENKMENNSNWKKQNIENTIQNITSLHWKLDKSSEFRYGVWRM